MKLPLSEKNMYKLVFDLSDTDGLLKTTFHSLPFSPFQTDNGGGLNGFLIKAEVGCSNRFQCTRPTFNGGLVRCQEMIAIGDIDRVAIDTHGENIQIQKQ